MKYSLILGALLVSSISQAAVTKCTFQKSPCNDQGDQYECRMFGWIGPNEVKFCSPNDVSTGHRFECSDCYSMQKPTQECKDICNCDTVFCGGW